MSRKTTPDAAAKLGVSSELSGFAEAPQKPFVIEPAPTLAVDRVATVMASAREARLLDNKTARISGRVSPVLVQQAKRRSGMMSDTDLIEFALASVALDDPFPDVFEQVRGTVDPDIELGF